MTPTRAAHWRGFLSEGPSLQLFETLELCLKNPKLTVNEMLVSDQTWWGSDLEGVQFPP